MTEVIKSLLFPDGQMEFLKEGLTFVNKNNIIPSLVIYSNDEEFEVAKEYGANFAVNIKYNDYIEQLCILSGTINEIHKKHNLNMILLPANVLGLELGPKLALRLGGTYISNAVDYETTGSEIVFKKLVYSGVGIELIKTKKIPIIISIKEGFEESVSLPNTKTQVLTLDKYYDRSFSENIKLIKQEKIKAVDIRSADKLAVVGRGLKNKEDLNMIKNLASLLEAEIGGSRPIVTDYKWLEDYRQIGLSGITVRPKLYIGIGVSGQIHHIMGMKDSKVIVAINKDPNAPIKEYSDYFIKGDLYVLMPKLIKELKELYNINKSHQV